MSRLLDVDRDASQKEEERSQNDHDNEIWVEAIRDQIRARDDKRDDKKYRVRLGRQKPVFSDTPAPPPTSVPWSKAVNVGPVHAFDALDSLWSPPASFDNYSIQP